MNLEVNLSKLEASRKNPRRVKPEREAHRKLVASIRAHGLLEPLIVSVIEPGRYRVIAGNRRLAALRDVHRHDDARVSCVVREADDDTAASLSLAENFAREPMHPLDEAEAFARLASVDCKGVAAIAGEFGVSQTYVRQRMKLAGLAPEIKRALRSNEIGVAVAEAFAAVPTDRQVELWKETAGQPRSVQQVRGQIENEWIPAEHALFDVSTLEWSSLSHDLFGGGTLVERSAFLSAQADALIAQRAELLAEGWKEVVITRREDTPSLLTNLTRAEVSYDAATMKKLIEIRERRTRLEETEIGSDEAEERLTAALQALDEEENRVCAESPGHYTEATKATGTVFLILFPDGRVERSYRQPRASVGSQKDESAGGGDSVAGPEAKAETDAESLTDAQRAEVYTHEALAVREAIAGDRLVQKRLIVLALHGRITPDALAVRREASPTTRHAERKELFRSSLVETQRARRRKVDPLFADDAGSDQGAHVGHRLDEVEAYTAIKGLSENELDALIAVLIVEAFTGHTQRATPLVGLLREELNVSVREHWTPGSEWLAGYRKSRLAGLVGELKGPMYGSIALKSPKTEVVKTLAEVFAKAAESPESVTEPDVAERLNAWVPAMLGDNAAVSMAG